jgi:hypothetical protein
MLLFWGVAHYICKLVVFCYNFINLNFISVCYINGSSYIKSYCINLINFISSCRIDGLQSFKYINARGCKVLRLCYSPMYTGFMQCLKYCDMTPEAGIGSLNHVSVTTNKLAIIHEMLRVVISIRFAPSYKRGTPLNHETRSSAHCCKSLSVCTVTVGTYTASQTLYTYSKL